MGLQNENPQDIVSKTKYGLKTMVSIYVTKTGKYFISCLKACTSILHNSVKQFYHNMLILLFPTAKINMKEIEYYILITLSVINRIYQLKLWHFLLLTLYQIPYTEFQSPEELKENICDVLVELGPDFITRLFVK